MKYVNLKKISLMLVVASMIIGTASAAVSVDLAEEEEECDLDIWTYGNHNSITSGFESYFTSTVVGSTWTDADGRLAVISENGHMLIETEYPTECFCIIFASDSNDGYAGVYVDGTKVWEGDTWADIPTAQPIGAQKIRSLEIAGLDNTVHDIKIKNLNGDYAHNGHVTIYKYGYDCPENAEVPEFPTIALPVAAIIGLAFIFHRKEE